MNSVTVKGYAKINLTLDVVGKRSDGYHFVEMIMQQVDLYDEVSLEPCKDRIVLSSSCDCIPLDSNNLAWKAAERIIKFAGINTGVKIHIDKKIPVCAGLAGGSSNAAAVIEGMDRLFSLNMKLEEKLKLGLALGADVPFCLLGGAALAKGIGEELTPILGFKDGWIVISKPNFGVSTQEVYQALEWDKVENHPKTDQMLDALKTDDFASICSGLSNVLESVTLKKYPEVKKLKDMMIQYGAEGALMSGSGPTVFGIFKTYEKAQGACERLKTSYEQSYVVKTRVNREDQE